MKESVIIHMNKEIIVRIRFLFLLIFLKKFLFHFNEIKISIFVLPFRLSDLVILLQVLRKSPVEMTIQRLGKNNKEIFPLYSVLLAVKME